MLRAGPGQSITLAVVQVKLERDIDLLFFLKLATTTVLSVCAAGVVSAQVRGNIFELQSRSAAPFPSINVRL